MQSAMQDKLAVLSARYQELTLLLGNPEVISSPDRLREAAREHSQLKNLVETYQRYQFLSRRLEETEEIARGNDPELAALAKDEIRDLREQKERTESQLKTLLLPRDPLEDKNAVLEIRAGTGGEEAALFARELFEMYRRYAERQGWRIEVLSTSASEQGGFKEIISLISGREVYRHLRFESGVHRVQRVPVTESQGRIHTSAVTVAVLAEAEEVEVKIEESDLKTDVFRAAGPGGQHVNTTDSAVRITHKPTGIVVTCQDERSQHKNRNKAMKILRARLLELERERQHEERAVMRKSMVKSGDRSEKNRTYNFPQSRVTDHRVQLSLHKLDRIMAGELDELIEALIADETARRLACLEAGETS